MALPSGGARRYYATLRERLELETDTAVRQQAARHRLGGPSAEMEERAARCRGGAVVRRTPGDVSSGVRMVLKFCVWKIFRAASLALHLSSFFNLERRLHNFHIVVF